MKCLVLIIVLCINFFGKGLRTSSFRHSKGSLIKLYETQDQIDPLEGVKESLRPVQSAKKDGESKTTRSKKKVFNEKEISSTAKSKQLNLNQRIINEQRPKPSVEAIEAQILERLPFDISKSFQDLRIQYSIRFAMISLTVHTMLLIPGLRYIKFVLDQSIIPYLYIGPFLIVFPFFVNQLWEIDLIKVPIIEGKLLRFLLLQHEEAKICLEAEENSLLEALEKGIGDEFYNAKRLAVLRLFSKIDVQVLTDEILSKKMFLLEEGKIRGYDSLPALGFGTNLGLSDSQDGKSIPIKEFSVTSAVKKIVNDAKLRGESKETLLENLKDMEKKLNVVQSLDSSDEIKK